MNSKHVEVLRQMWQQCANDRRMIEADALDAAIAVLSAPAEAQAQDGGDACPHCMGNPGLDCNSFGRTAAPPNAPIAQGGGEVVYIGAWAFDQLMSNKYVSCQLDTHGRATYSDGRPPVPLYTAPPSAPVGVEGVRRYLASRDAKPMRGIDPEVIHAIHIGTEWEAELRMSDLRSLAQHPAPVGVDAHKATLASLVAAVSLLRRGGGSAAPSDAMFNVMMADYEKSIEASRDALAQQPAAVDEMAELVGLLDEVRSHFTRDDDLPDDLLPRIDAALRWIAGGSDNDR